MWLSTVRRDVSVSRLRISGLAYAFGLAALAGLRTRHFWAGRFWAEEGAELFPTLKNGSAWQALHQPFHGHLELLTNLIVYAAGRMPFALSAGFATYASATIALLFPVCLWRLRGSLGLADVHVVLVTVALMGMPQAEEVWANSINLHFHLAIVVALLLMSPESAWPPLPVLVGGLALVGLSGVPSHFLLPIALVRAWRLRTRAATASAVVMVLTSAFQLALLVSNHFVGRRPSFSLEAVIGSMLQQVVVPTFSRRASHFLDQVGALLHGAEAAPSTWVLLVAAVVVWFILMAIPLVWGRMSARVALMGSVLLLAGSIPGALGDPSGFVSAIFNGRYLFAPNVLLVLSLTLVAADRDEGASGVPRVFRLVALAFVCTVAARGLVSRMPVIMSGPSWLESLAVSRAAGSPTVEIWPAGWSMPRLDGPNE